MKRLIITGVAALALLSFPALTHADILQNEITIAGTVTLKSGNTLIIRNGAVDTQVIVDQDTRMINRVGGSISYTDIELGDRIQAFGELVTTRTLVADTIRNVVLPAGAFEQAVTGTLSSKLGGTLLVRSGIADIEVQLDQDTLILDRVGHRMSLSGLEIGDRVQAFGGLTNGVLDADTLIDLSLVFDGVTAGVVLGGNTYLAPTQNVVAPTPASQPATPPTPTPTPQQTAPQSPPIQILGILMGKSGNTLTVMSAGEAWSIQVDQNTLGFDKNETRMSFARMRIGDTLQIAGHDLGNNTIHAVAVKDISISFSAINAAAKKAATALSQSAVKKSTTSSGSKANSCKWVCS